MGYPLIQLTKWTKLGYSDDMNLYRIFSLILLTFVIHASAHAQPVTDPRIAQLFAKNFNNSSVYIDNKCHDNIARFLILLQNAGINIHKLHAMEIENGGLYDFGMVAAQTTRIYPQNWFHHVVLYDGVYVYDFDFTKTPTPITPAKYFHQMFKTPTHQVNRAICDKVLGTYKITFRPAALYLQRYAGVKLPRGYTLEPVEKKMTELRGWGCDYTVR